MRTLQQIATYVPDVLADLVSTRVAQLGMRSVSAYVRQLLERDLLEETSEFEADGTR